MDLNDRAQWMSEKKQQNESGSEMKCIFLFHDKECYLSSKEKEVKA